MSRKLLKLLSQETSFAGRGMSLLSRDHSLLSSSQVFPTPPPFPALALKSKESLEIASAGTRNVTEPDTDCMFLVNVTHSPNGPYLWTTPREFEG